MVKSISFVVISGLALALAFSNVSAAPIIGIDKEWDTELWLNACQDGSSFVLFNDGDDVLEWTITTSEAWLAVEPSSGSNIPGPANGTLVTISVDRSGLGTGTYSSFIYITGNAPQRTEFVVIEVKQTPDLMVGPSTFGLSLEHPDHVLDLHNDGRETLNWSVTSYPSWIDISPPLSGSLECEAWTQLSIHLDAAELPSPDEAQTGEIVIDSNGGANTVAVSYEPAMQVADLIGIFSDPQGTNCNILYTAPQLLPVYVVHTRSVGATASQFSAPIPACWTNAVWLSDTGIWPINIGNSQTGIAIGYGTCLESPIHPLTINYFVQGPPTETCCYYPVLPDPNATSGEIEVVDCNNVIWYAQGGIAALYPTAECMCEGGTVRTEESTWGRVKALYAPEAQE